MILIHLMGIDGSGKTTHAKRFIRKWKSTRNVHYLYLQYFPFLLLPAKWLAKKTILKGTNEFKDYHAYAEKKTNFTKKRKWMTRIYSFLWYSDYLLQVIPKMVKVEKARQEVYIIDRYYLDSVVNLACLMDMGREEMIRDAKRIEKLLPRADFHIFMNVDEKIAFTRKNDIQSVRYLKERKTKYLLLSDVYGYRRIDAAASPDSVYRNLEKMILELTA